MWIFFGTLRQFGTYYIIIPTSYKVCSIKLTSFFHMLILTPTSEKKKESKISQLINPINSSIINKYDGPNDDSICFWCVSHQWI